MLVCGTGCSAVTDAIAFMAGVSLAGFEDAATALNFKARRAALFMTIGVHSAERESAEEVEVAGCSGVLTKRDAARPSNEDIIGC